MSSQIIITGVVLKKTKLGEADLSVTLLAEDGSCAQVVARGARKPKNSFASRLELFSCVELFCAATKGLPLVQEARLVDAHAPLRLDFDRSTAASVVAELVAKATHEDVATPRLFPLCDACLRAMTQCVPEKSYALALATCLKVFAFVGLRPRFSACASCGEALFERDGAAVSFVAFASAEGGCLCDTCAASAETVLAQVNFMQWLDALLYATFDQVVEMDIPAQVLSYGFHFVQDWTRVHLGAHLKSIPFLLTNATLSEPQC